MVHAVPHIHTRKVPAARSQPMRTDAATSVKNEATNPATTSMSAAPVTSQPADGPHRPAGIAWRGSHQWIPGRLSLAPMLATHTLVRPRQPAAAGLRS